MSPSPPPTLAQLWARLRPRLWSLQAAFYAGLALLAASLPILAQMARERWDEARAERRYTVNRLERGFEATFEGHVITVNDRFRRGEGSTTTVVDAPVEIRIDGRDYSIPAALRIDTALGDPGRYWNYLSLGTLIDNESGSRRFYLVQCLPADTLREYPLSISWRLLLVDPSGAVHDEIFAFDERADPLYRTVLARTASPAPLGFHSQVLAVWPSLLFPVLYPFASALLGGVLVAARAWVPWLKPRLRLA